MNKPVRRRTRTRGFTVVELAVSLTLTALLLGLLATALGRAKDTFVAGSGSMLLEERGSKTLRRIVDSLQAAESTSVTALPAPPFSADAIDFQISLGYEAQQTLWSAPRRIARDAIPGQVVWIESPGLPEEQRSRWCRGVAEYLEGELPNGLDDNGNGLIDESGLCFTQEGGLLWIRLTLEGERAQGDPILRTWTTSLICRN